MRRTLIITATGLALAMPFAACGGDSPQKAAPPATAAKKPLTKAELIQRVQHGVAKVFAEDELGKSSGSAILIDADKGLLVTNAHVVRTAGSLSVRFAGVKGQIPATILGVSDCRGDLAAIKIDPDDVPEKAQALTFAESNQAKVGDELAVVGYQGTIRGWNTAKPRVSFGVVSDTGIANADLGPEIARGQGSLLMTDATLDHGVSGGVMANTFGEVVAIATYSAGPGDGYGFEADVVRKTLPDLVKGRGGTTGVQTIPVSELDMADVIYALHADKGVDRAMARSMGRAAEDLGGLFVVGATANSPADRKGIRFGHVIRKMNGIKVGNQTQLCKVQRSSSVVKVEGYDLEWKHFADDFTRRVRVK